MSAPLRRVAGLLLLAAVGARLLGAGAVATLDRNTTAAGDPVQLSLTVTGGRLEEAPTWPNVAGLSIQYGGESTQVQIVNSQMSSSVVYSYLVTASKPGDYTIPALQVAVGGQTLSTQPLKLSVGKGDNRLAQVAFLQLVPPGTNAFLGEAMVFDIRLFAQAGQLVQPPQLKGEAVTVGKLVAVGQTPVQTNGIVYTMVTWRVPVTFVKTGDFALNVGDCVLDVPFRQPGRQRGPFGLGIDDFFGVQSRRLTLASEPVKMTVHPLPADNVPPGFNGAVGDFKLSASLSTNVVSAGDPLTLTVQLAGHGPIDSLKWEPAGTWTGFKTYAPSTTVKTSDDLGLTGVKVFEQAIVPENAQVKEVPPISFAFFDPEKRQYRVVTHPGTPITVRPATAVAAQPVVIASPGQSRAEEKPATDIVHIKARPGALAQISPPLLERPGFLALQSVPVLAWLAALTWRRRTDRLARDPRLRRHQQVTRLVRAGLNELRQLAEQNRGEDFFALLFRLLQEQLGERLDLPATAITEAVVEERLQPLGLDAGLLVAIRELFQLCDQARYAPNQHAAELTALVTRIETTLPQLQSIPTDARP